MRFDNPHVCLLLGSQAVEVGVKVSELVRQDVRVRYNIEQIFAEAFLHFNNVFAQSIFSSELIGAGKVVYLLVLVHGFVHEGLKTLRGPEHVPLVALCLAQTIRLHDSFDQLCVGLDHFEKHIELSLFVLTWLCVAKLQDSFSHDLNAFYING